MTDEELLAFHVRLGEEQLDARLAHVKAVFRSQFS